MSSKCKRCEELEKEIEQLTKVQRDFNKKLNEFHTIMDSKKECKCKVRK